MFQNSVTGNSKNFSHDGFGVLLVLITPRYIENVLSLSDTLQFIRFSLLFLTKSVVLFSDLLVV